MQILQGIDQGAQRALTVLLGGQLLRHCQLIKATGQGDEIQCLTALHLRTQQAADGQRLRAFDGQAGACQCGVEQHHDGAVRGRCRSRVLPGQQVDRLRDHLAGHDLALQQGADRQPLSIKAGHRVFQRTVELLQGQCQFVGRRLRYLQQATGRERYAAGDRQAGLGAIGQHQTQQQLEVLVDLLEGQYFGVGGLAFGDEIFRRLH